MFPVLLLRTAGVLGTLLHVGQRACVRLMEDAQALHHGHINADSSAAA